MITVWPQYLDKNLSLKEGLNLPYSTQKERSYPGKWYEKSGRILVESDKPKLELLKEISLKLQEIKQ